MARAISSLPVPLSPRMRTVARESATCRTVEDLPHGGEFADDLFEAEPGVELLVEGGVFRLQLPGAQRLRSIFSSSRSISMRPFAM
jgi:hypothetical protein